MYMNTHLFTEGATVAEDDVLSGADRELIVTNSIAPDVQFKVYHGQSDPLSHLSCQAPAALGVAEVPVWVVGTGDEARMRTGR